jgi:hypothetical protein
MNWATLSLGILALIVSAGCNCWRPYYGTPYAQPAYATAPAYQQPAPIYTQPAPIVQSQPAPIIQSQPAPMVSQSPVMQGCPPVYCQPCPQPCVPCY